MAEECQLNHSGHLGVRYSLQSQGTKIPFEESGASGTNSVCSHVALNFLDAHNPYQHLTLVYSSCRLLKLESTSVYKTLTQEP